MSGKLNLCFPTSVIPYASPYFASGCFVNIYLFILGHHLFVVDLNLLSTPL